MNQLLLNNSPIRAAQNKQRGRQFDMPDLDQTVVVTLNTNKEVIQLL